MVHKPKRAGIIIELIIESNPHACVDLYSSDSRNFSSEHAPHSKQASIAVRSFVPGLKSPLFTQPKSYSPKKGNDDCIS